MPLNTIAAVLFALAVYVLESIFASGVILAVALAVTAIVAAVIGLLMARDVKRHAP